MIYSPNNTSVQVMVTVRVADEVLLEWDPMSMERSTAATAQNNQARSGRYKTV
jgi:hypothetical protein